MQCSVKDIYHIVYPVHVGTNHKLQMCTSHVKCIDQPHQDLFSFESDNDEDHFCPECFYKEPDDKIRHHAIADDFTFIYANLISIHLYIYFT